MCTRVLLNHSPIILVCLALTGCWSVAASVTGGSLLGIEAYLLHRSADETVTLSMADTERATRRALDELGVCILKATPTVRGPFVTRWDFDAGVVGDDVTSIDIILKRVSRDLTDISVTATTGPLCPGAATAQSVLDRILKVARKNASHTTDPNQPHLSHGG